VDAASPAQLWCAATSSKDPKTLIAGLTTLLSVVGMLVAEEAVKGTTAEARAQLITQNIRARIRSGETAPTEVTDWVLNALLPAVADAFNISVASYLDAYMHPSDTH